MQNFANRQRSDLNAAGIRFGQTRIGVHSGDVIVGNFGGKTIFDYRALGDAVNTASRLENANKYLGTGICVSEDCLSACSGIVSRPVGRLLMKGKAIPLMAYEALHPEALERGALERYCAAYRSLADASPEAASAFERYLADYPEDKLAAFHLQRLKNGCQGDLIELPDK